MQFWLLHFYMKVNKLVKQATVKIQFILKVYIFKSLVAGSEEVICTFIVVLYQQFFGANLDAKLYWVIDQWAGNGVDQCDKQVWRPWPKSQGTEWRKWQKQGS